MLLSKDAIAEALETLNQDGSDFYDGRHAIIFRAIVGLFNREIPADAVTVASSLSPEDLRTAGGAPYLHTCMSKIPSAASTRWYAKIVKERALACAAVRLGTQITQIGYATPDGMAALDQIGQLVYDATMSRADQGRTGVLGDLLQPTLDEIEAALTRPAGISTPWADLNRLFAGGLHPGQLIIPAGRPGAGKSVFGLDVARHAAIRHNLTTLYFSLEMGQTDLMTRLLSAESKIPMHVLRSGQLSDDDWAKLARRMGDISEAPLYLDDTSAISLSQIRAKARRLKQTKDLKLIIVDYLQLMTPPRTGPGISRAQEVGEISTGLKNLARDLGIPVVAMCQLNRDLEKRADKRPVLSDLRESGGLEQDADVVIGIHRPDQGDPESPRAGEADFIVLKQRQGATDTVAVAAQLHLSRFVDMAVG